MMCGQFSVLRLIEIDGWVMWLLYCYVLFWVAYKTNLKHKDVFISVGVILFSVWRLVVSPGSGWPTEIYGFIWGILLANKKEKLTESIAYGDGGNLYTVGYTLELKLPVYYRNLLQVHQLAALNEL